MDINFFTENYSENSQAGDKIYEMKNIGIQAGDGSNLDTDENISNSLNDSMENENEIDDNEILDSEYQKGFCCFRFTKKKKCPSLYMPFFLDMIEDHTRSRWYTALQIIIICAFSIHLTYLTLNLDDFGLQFIANVSDIVSNSTSSIGEAVAAKIWLWVQYIGISMLVCLSTFPVFLGTSVWQNRFMNIVSFLFMLMIIGIFLFMIRFTIVGIEREKEQNNALTSSSNSSSPWEV